jgi:phage shock protein C
MHKKLYRSRERRLVSGVMGGLGQYFHTDPVILRLILIIIILATGVFPGLIAYIVAVFMIPEEAFITPSKPIPDDDRAV